MVEEEVIREAPDVPTGGQAGRWQAITDTTTIESSLLDFLCRLYKENHSRLGVSGLNQSRCYGGRGCHQRGAGCADWRPGG